jgi:hypothetical protein
VGTSLWSDTQAASADSSAPRESAAARAECQRFGLQTLVAENQSTGIVRRAGVEKRHKMLVSIH